MYTVRQTRLRMAAMIYGNLVTVACEVAYDVRSDEPGTANDKNPHWFQDNWASAMTGFSICHRLWRLRKAIASGLDDMGGNFPAILLA